MKIERKKNATLNAGTITGAIKPQKLNSAVKKKSENKINFLEHID